MAAGDRRKINFLYTWQKFDWARNALGTEQPTKIANPTISAITATTATVTVGYTGFGAQHRVLYGRATNNYECRTGVLVQPVAPGTVAFGLRELRPNTTYYVCAIGTPLGPFPNGGDQSGVPVTSPEVTFTTGVGTFMEGMQSPDGQSEMLMDGGLDEPEVTTDGGAGVPVP